MSDFSSTNMEQEGKTFQNLEDCFGHARDACPRIIAGRSGTSAVGSEKNWNSSRNGSLPPGLGFEQSILSAQTINYNAAGASAHVLTRIDVLQLGAGNVAELETG